MDNGCIHTIHTIYRRIMNESDGAKIRVAPIGEKDDGVECRYSWFVWVCCGEKTHRNASEESRFDEG